MERLEISIINFSEISNENSSYRIDSEFFKKEYLKEDFLRKKYVNKNLGQIAFITDGQHGYHEVDENSEIRHLKAQNFKNWFAVDNNAERIAKWVDDKNRRSSLILNDIVLTTRGTVGFCSIVKENVLPANIDQDVARIALNSNDEYLPQYLLSYINSKFGKDWTKRNQTGMVQQGLSLIRLREFPIPKLNIEFQLKIGNLIEKSHDLINLSSQNYKNAETLLFKEIGLETDPLISNELVTGSNPGAIINTNVKSFKESFGLTGRLDAEYYQKKYEVVIEKIKSQKHDTLHSIAEINKSIEPGSYYYSDDETGLPFMRVADYNKFGQSEPNKKLTFDFVKDNQDKIDDLKPKKGIILFSKDGSVGTAYHLREDFNGVTSSAILHLKVRNKKEVIPEYLTLALNSKLVQMQAERDAGGSIILHWRVGEIQNVVVPIIDYKKQQEIAQLIEESFSLKKQSEHLLEVAKKAVEIAIEESEEVAINFINENT